MQVPHPANSADQVQLLCAVGTVSLTLSSVQAVMRKDMVASLFSIIGIRLSQVLYNLYLHPQDSARKLVKFLLNILVR